MADKKVLFLTYPLSWARDLRAQFSADEADIAVKAPVKIDGFVAEHLFYEPGTNADAEMPKDVGIELNLALRRCFLGSAARQAQIAGDVWGNAGRILATGNYRTIIFRTVPHLAHEFAIYHQARARGIPTWFFDETGYFGRAFIFSDIYVRQPQAACQIKNGPPFAFTQAQRQIASLDELRKNYHGLRKTGRGRIRSFGKVLRTFAYLVKSSLTRTNVAGSAGYCRNIVRNNLFDRFVFWGRVVFRTWRLRVLLEALEARPADPDRKGFVIFLLNFQPERTTLPDAHPYYDSRRCVSELVDAGHMVLVKEHPIELNYPGDGALLRGATWRSAGFYADLDAMADGFLPRSLQIDEGLASDNLIATASGTVAVEMFFRHRPVLVLANNWIASLPNVQRPGAVARPLVQPKFSYDPFKALEAIFVRTVSVPNWGKLTRADGDVLRVLVAGQRTPKPTKLGKGAGKGTAQNKAALAGASPTGPEPGS